MRRSLPARFDEQSQRAAITVRAPDARHNFNLKLSDASRRSPIRYSSGRAALTIDNVDRAIITSLRNIGTTPATLLIEIVTSNTPDTVEFSSGNLTLRDVQGTPYR